MRVFFYSFNRQVSNCFSILFSINLTLRQNSLKFLSWSILLFILFNSNSASSQVTTNGGSGLAVTYTSLANAITALNAATINSPVVITLTGDEVAPAGGYSITQIGGTATNTITIIGNNSTITAAAAPTIGSRTDAIFKIIGGDYITIRDFTMIENPSNTIGGALASQRMTEFGVALFAASTTNGAQNNTIQNDTITLSSTTAYQNAIGIFSTCASSSTNGVQAAASIAGTNSNNKFYGNIISGVAQGLYFIAPAQTATVFESNNDIGGLSMATGNKITFGVSNTAGDLGFTSYSGLTPAGIYFRNTVGSSVKYNTINSLGTLTLVCGGIFSANGTAPTGITYTTNFSNNNITLNNVGTTGITGIDFGSGLATGTMISNNNTITINQNCIAASSAAVTGIKAAYTSASNTCNGNNITINQSETSGALSSITIGIDMSGTGTSLTSQSNTVLINQTTSSATAWTTAITGIKATTASTTVNIGGPGLNNTVTIKQAITGSGVYGSCAVTFIDAAAGHGTLNILNNEVNTTGSSLRTTGTIYGISHSGTITAALNVSNNTINIDASAGAASTAAFYGIYTAGSSTITSNYNINSNTITLVTKGTSTGTAGIRNAESSGGACVKTINGNSVTITGSGTPIYGLYFNYGVHNIGASGQGNTISVTTSALTPTIYGIYTGAGSSDKNYFNYNTISTLSATAASTSAPIITGLYVQSYNNCIIAYNTISGITTGAGSGSATITAIDIAQAAGISTVNNNKIFNISTSNTGTSTIINGIRISNGTTHNVFNNLIGITGSFTGVNSAEAIRAINITSTTSSSTFNVYFNTIRISATSTGTNFGTTGIYHTTSTTATTAALDLRNNIIVNTSTANGTGFISAYRRSNTTLTNYANTSNNNLFYAGTPGVKNLIMYNGTNSYQTIADYKTAVGPTRDAASISENPNFVSVNGSDGTFLHINNTIPTAIESGGSAIATYTTDFDGDTRDLTTPDIGADEFAFIGIDMKPVAFVSPIATGCYTSAESVTITIQNSGSSTIDFSVNPVTVNVVGSNAAASYSSNYVVSSGTLANGATLDVTMPATIDMTGNGTYSFTASTSVTGDINTSNDLFPIVNRTVFGGTYTVGTTGDFATLTAAVSAYNNATCLNGPVIFSLIDASYSVSETFPISINLNPYASAINTLTIIPANGVAATITGSNATALITFNGAKYVSIDGRQSGSGTPKSIVISNTSTTGPAVIFVNDANNNTVEYSVVKGVITTTTSGVVVFGATTGTAGNDYNTIDNCDLTSGATAAANIIYAAGTSLKENDNNTISNNNIFNFGGATACGINISTYNNSYSITGNSFYQTAALTTASTMSGITIVNTAGGNFTINNNYFGGNASALTGGAISGTWTANTSGLDYRFCAISLSLASSPVSTISGNKIQNFSIITGSAFTTAPSAFSGIYLINSGGTTVTGNTIGSTSSAGNISVSFSTGSNCSVSGIYFSGNGAINVTNNTIAGVSILNPSSGALIQSLYGIYATSSSTGPVTITGNTVGTASAGLNNATGNTYNSTLTVYTAGIFAPGALQNIINNNLVTNIAYSANGNATTGINQTVGIFHAVSGGGAIAGANNSVQNNVVRNISSSSLFIGATTTASAIGILFNTSSTGNTVGQNTVHSISNNATTANAVNVTGVFYGVTTSGTNILERNFVHSLSLNTTSTTSVVNGIYVATGNSEIRNNMIRLGIDAGGSSVTKGFAFNGINEAAGTNNYYFNTIYVGGINVVSVANTYAFLSAVASGTRNIQNNIFWNARTNTSGSAYNYAIKIGATTGLTCNYNDLYVTSSAQFGAVAAVNHANFTAWKSVTGMDAASVSGNPQLLNAAGDASSVDLHINSLLATPVESVGNNIASITIDYDNESRAALTPTDIGADAGDFTPADVTPPNISYTLLPNTSNTAGPVLIATVTDASGINITTGTAPRLYFKRSYDANTFNDNTNATDGWKWIECTTPSGNSYSFNFDYSLIYNSAVRPVQAGDFIQYFVVVQDNATIPNVSLYSGTPAVSPVTTVNDYADLFALTGTINQYWILPSQGTYTVGSSGPPASNYSTLTGANGFFAGMNDANTRISGNITMNIIADITEPGTNGLNQWTETPANNVFTVTIQPDAAVLRTISGTAVAAGTPMININGADRVTFDGNFSGSGQYLLFRNTNSTASSTGPTIQFINSCVNGTIKNCIIENNGTTATRGTVNISTGTNTNISISNNKITPSTGGTVGTPAVAVYSATTTNVISVLNNEIYNWSSNGVLFSGVADNCYISNNSFYQSSTLSTAQTAITISSGNSHTISGNFIGGTAPNCGGTAWVNSGNVALTGISLTGSTTTATSVQGNIIANLSMTTSSSSATFIGINLTGTGVNKYNIGTTTGNTIGSNTINNSISISGPGTFTGIKATGAATSLVNISNNTISGISQTSTSAINQTIGIYTLTNGVFNINKNTISKMTSAAQNSGFGTSSTIIGILATSPSAGQIISGNTIHSLTHTAVSTSIGITGVAYSGPTTGTNLIERNNIHSFNSGTTGNLTELAGIYLAGTAICNVENNMIRLGIQSDGSPVSAANIISGIYDNSTGVNKLYYNSVYIGGYATSVAQSAVTFAYRRNAGTGADEVKNNVFYNARGAALAASKHYAISINATTAIIVNYNDLFVNSSYTNAFCGYNGTTDYNTLSAWASATGFDGNSVSGNPQFINPTGDTSAVNLHIKTDGTPTPVESAASIAVAVTNDIDAAGVRTGYPLTGQVNGGGSAPDLGADEGDFFAADITPPVITYTALANSCNSSTTYNVGSIAITDPSGVNTTAGTKPRLYFKKSTDANDLTAWKYVEANGTASPFDFTIDFSLLNSGSVTAGEVIQYFVVAQDLSPSVNTAIKSGSALFANTPASVNLTSAAFPISGTPNSFSVLPCSGNITVGTGGNYNNLTGATGFFQAVNATSSIGGLSGDITCNLISDLTEDGANALNQWLEQGGTGYQITIQPNSTTERLISGTVANGMIRLDGADRVIIDGNFSGSGKYLRFRNANTSNPDLTFINDACNNTIRNCYIEGANTTAASGTVLFSTALTSGNDNNTISNCDIKDYTTTLPVNAIYSAGTTGKENSGNTIQNCNIYNFFSNSSASSGISLMAGNTAWTITGNNFYQTVSRTSAAADNYVIRINDANGTNFVVTNNLIGGSASDGTGTYSFNNSTGTNKIIGIYLQAVSTASPYSNISGNTIKNIYVKTSSGGSVWGIFSGIHLVAGTATIDNNIIGAETGNTSIYTYSTTSGATTYGINSVSAATNITITNNKIGGIDVEGGTSTTNTGVNFTGIYMSTGSTTVTGISGNIIGSLTTASSIRLVSSNASTAACAFYGIRSGAGSGFIHYINNNTISNITNNNLTSGGLLDGIAASGGGQYIINNNNISNLKCQSPNSGIGASACLIGISLSTASTLNLSVSSNTISNLIHVASSGVTGIYFSGGTSSSNIVSKNNIYNIYQTSAGTPVVNGINIGSGAVTVSNNFVRLGFDENGNPVTVASTFNGILKEGTSAGKFYYNSVYIGGSGVATTAKNTTAFTRSATGTDEIKNNIFYNARSNATTGGKHYSVYLNNQTTLSEDNNILFVNGTGSVMGYDGTADRANISVWKSNTPFDDNSVSADPQYIDPIAAIPDLHLSTLVATPAESGAIAIIGLTDDFDALNIRTGYPLTGQVNGGGTAPDIGADEGDFMPIDVAPPSFVYTSIPTQALCGSTTTTVNVTINDLQSGISLSSNKPRMYFRRSVGGAPADTWDNSQYVEGTYVSGTTNSSIWTFTLDYNLFGITLASGNSFEYYFVAQDLAPTPNIGYSQSNGSSPVHTPDLATPTIFPGFTFGASGTYTVNGGALSGIVYIDPSSQAGDVAGVNWFTSLTKFDGLFAKINSVGLSGDLFVKVRGATITEDGNMSTLYQWTEYCGSGYRVVISPSDASLKTLSGSLAAMGLFTIYNADNVTIDGSFNGSGRYLKFANTYSSTGGSENDVFKIDGHAANDTIRNCDIEGQSAKTAGGVLYIASSSVNNCLFENNLIHGGSAWAINIIYATGGSNITIKNNEIYNFLAWSGGTTTRAYGINVSTGSGSNWSINGNSIYNTGINGQSVQTALSFKPGASSTGNTISNNWIGGSSAQCGTSGSVTYWGNSYTTTGCTEVQGKAIDVNAGTVTIDGNNISNIFFSGCDYVGFVCTHIQGTTIATLTNNVFGTGSNGQPDNSKMIKVSGGGCTSCAAPGYIYGIWNQSSSSSAATYDHNDFYYLWQSGAYYGGSVQCITHQAAGPAIVTNNRINGPQAAGLGLVNSFGIRLEPTTSNSGNLIKKNMIAGPYINGMDVTAYGSGNFAIYVKILGTYVISGTIENNVVWDMRNADYGGTGVSEGIYVYSSTGGNGNWDIFNNQITLKNNGSTANCVGLYGIEVDLNSASTTNVQYNTVYIGGSNGGSGLTGADFGSYAYFRFPNSAGNVVGDALTLKNNIFINSRLVSTTAVTGHFAIANYGSSNFATNWNVSDNNFLFTNNGSKSYIGLWGTSTKLTLANWKTASSKDANSYSATITTGASNFGSGLLNPDVSNYLFNNPLSDLHINISDGQSYKFVDGRGAPISITTDFDGDTRDASTPDIGADEFTTASCTPVAVTSNPSAPAAACEGTNSFSFTVQVSGSPNFDYQWQVSPDGSSWSNISNGGVYGTTAVTTASASTSNTLTITNADASYNSQQYRCVVKNCNGTQTATSSAATLTVNPASVGGTATPVASAVCEGSNTIINLTGNTGTIQWQTNASGTWQNINGQTGTSYTTPNLTTTTSYQAVVTNAGCSSATSSTAQVTVSPPSLGGVAGAVPTTICAGGTSTIKLTGYTGTIQWQTDASGTWQNIGGATSDVYITPVINSTTSYQAVVTSGACASEVSNTIIITVESTPAQPDPISGSSFPCYGSSENYSVTNVSGMTYTWTFPADWVQTAGGTTNSVTVTVGHDTANVQVVATNSCGSGPARTLYVKPSYPGVWTGAVSSDWHDPNNWGCNTLPDSTTNIKIPDGSGNLPIINTIGTAFCHDLIIVPNASLILQSSGNLAIYGSLTSNGSFTASGTVIFAGYDQGNINGPVTGVNFSKITVYKKPDTLGILNINTAVSITSVSSSALAFNSGMVQINTGGLLSMKAGPTINPGSGINVNGGTLAAGNFSITNKGLFKVTSGTANVGTDPGNSLLSQSGSRTKVIGGQLNIASRMEVTCLNGAANKAYYSQTGGTLKICTIGNFDTEASLYFGAYSNINISGGVIEFQNASGNAAPLDFRIAAGSGPKIFSGGSIQFGNAGSAPSQHFYLSNDAAVAFYSMRMFNCDDLNLNSPVSINGTLDLVSGVVNSFIPNTFTFNLGANWTSASDNSFIKGPAFKVGNESFIFPVGDIQGTNKVFAPIGIDAPLQTTDIFKAQYGFTPIFYTYNPDSLLGNLGGTSHVENWDLSREVGVSQVKVSLYWKNTGRSGINDPNGILVAHYNSTLGKWEDMGATYFADGATSGHIEATVASDNFSPFTLGANKNFETPLPVSLIDFKAECNGENKEISWKTATEANNDYFTLERSTNGVDYQFVAQIDGAGNSNQMLSYNITDKNDLQIAYYKLIQTDFNGQTKIYGPVKVDCDNGKEKDIQIYPNPFESVITLALSNISDEDVSVNVYDMYGRLIEKSVYHISGNYNNMITLELDQLPAGIYYLEAKAKAFVRSTKIIKN